MTRGPWPPTSTLPAGFASSAAANRAGTDRLMTPIVPGACSHPVRESACASSRPVPHANRPRPRRSDERPHCPRIAATTWPGGGLTTTRPSITTSQPVKAKNKTMTPLATGCHPWGVNGCRRAASIVGRAATMVAGVASGRSRGYRLPLHHDSIIRSQGRDRHDRTRAHMRRWTRCGLVLRSCRPPSLP